MIEVSMSHLNGASPLEDIGTGRRRRIALGIPVDKGNPIPIVPRWTNLGHKGLNEIGKKTGESERVGGGLGCSW